MKNFIKRNREEIAMTVCMFIIWFAHMFIIVTAPYYAYTSYLEHDEDWWLVLAPVLLALPGACILPKVIKDEFIAKIK